MAASRYLGEDIIVSLEDDGNTPPLNFDNMREIIIHLFTKQSDIKRFSKTTREGYTKLVRVSPTRYDAILDSGQTATMTPGALQFGVRFFQESDSMPDGFLDDIAATQLLTLEDSTLKNESV